MELAHLASVREAAAAELACSLLPPDLHGALRIAIDESRGTHVLWLGPSGSAWRSHEGRSLEALVAEVRRLEAARSGLVAHVARAATRLAVERAASGTLAEVRRGRECSP